MAIYDLTESIPSIKSLKKDDILNCPYSGTYKSIILPSGTYKLECWGAQGGNYNATYTGGKGGYSTGILTLKEDTNLYLYVGGQGAGGKVTGKIAGGFNGGGAAHTGSTIIYSSAGGGGTDIRIGQDSLYARVIVAGGGGGCAYMALGNGTFLAGGVGGGENGTAGTQSSTSQLGGTGGSQTSIGISYLGTSAATSSTAASYGVIASFGTGGSGGSSTPYISGGGGGWYGGGFGRQAGSGGGSGYVYTESTASNYPSGYLLTSSCYLTEAETIAGNQFFPSFANSSQNETGHQGNGAIRITVLDIFTGFKIYIKNSESSYKQIKNIYLKTNFNTWAPITSVHVKKNENEWI